MYKVGDEVLIKVEVVEVLSAVPYPTKVRLGKDEDAYVFSNDELCYADKIVKTYEMGLKDAWELAKKIRVQQSDGGIPLNEIENIFGTVYIDTIFKNNTYEEALAKIEAYEKEKEIKVGDEVAHGCDGCETKFYVTYLTQNQIKGFSKDGDTHYFVFPNPYIKKTGKHIDIESLLRQIGE